MRGPGRLSLVAVAIFSTVGVAGAAPSPPAWPVMMKDARHAFEATYAWKIDRIVRAGEPEITAVRAGTDVIPTVYQDVDIVYTAKFGQVERRAMRLHYEYGLAGWTGVTFKWGETSTVRKGAYPAPPAPPSATEIQDAVKQGMSDFKVKPEHVDKVQAIGKPTFAWLDDAPTAAYTVQVRVSVEDVVERASAYEPVWRPRYLCEFKAVLVLDQYAWQLDSTVPDCAERGCSLQRMCKDSWGGGRAGKPGKPPPPR